MTISKLESAGDNSCTGEERRRRGEKGKKEKGRNWPNSVEPKGEKVGSENKTGKEIGRL